MRGLKKGYRGKGGVLEDRLCRYLWVERDVKGFGKRF